MVVRRKNEKIKRKPSRKQLASQQSVVEQKDASAMTFFLTMILIFMIIALLGVSVYFIYLNMPGEALRLNVELPEINNENTVLRSSFSEQFYPNMKFNHNNISYSMDFNCGDVKKERMLSAFGDISLKIPIVNFIEVRDNPDIEVSCSGEEKESLREDFFIAGEGGAREIIQTDKYNVITEGVILLYDDDGNNDLQECEWPNVEIHELMHVFGFNHSEDEQSIMYPYLEDCEQVLDLAIVERLRELYSEENLADLYFEEVNVIKRGRYLDFNLTVKNSGLINAKNVSISILDEGKIIEENDLGEINYGAGISLSISGLKLARKNPEEIMFVIDKDDNIKEMDDKNNIVKIKL
ncbi:matrixin family metalloprotease [archaeon]|jgi:hypothetical protein|nr:matrixin family metalloprotease [archaeon]